MIFAGEGGWLGDPFGPSESFSPPEDPLSSTYSEPKGPSSGTIPRRIQMPAPSDSQSTPSEFKTISLATGRKRKRRKKVRLAAEELKAAQPGPKLAKWDELLKLQF